MSGRLRRGLAIRAPIAWTLLAIAAVRIARAARHPLLWAGCLGTRIVRRTPRRDPDGEPLTRGEMRAFIGIVRGWRLDARRERSRT